MDDLKGCLQGDQCNVLWQTFAGITLDQTLFEFKGGAVSFNSKLIIVTSLHTPEEWFGSGKMWEYQFNHVIRMHKLEGLRPRRTEYHDCATNEEAEELLTSAVYRARATM